MDLSTITHDHGVFTVQVNSALSPFMSGIYNLLNVLWFFFSSASESIYKGFPENNF